ncbi:MAG: alkaline phosphatase family protein [Actinomycetota bacterium]
MAGEGRLSAARRRQLAATVFVAAAGLLTVACQLHAASSDERTPSAITAPSTSVPTPPPPRSSVDATSIPTRWPIKHVVFLIKENRSFDNLFGTFPGADGVTIGWDQGVERRLVRGTDQATGEDVPHCYECALLAWNGGRMDGFNQSPEADHWAYTQLHHDQLPNYWRWAKHDVLFDRFFAAAQGPSFPNHLYTIAAQSGGAHDNPRRDPELGSLTFGCDAPAQQLVEVVDSEGVLRMIPPCFDFLTEGDLLNEAGIPWAYYAAEEDQKGYIWSAYSAIRRYRESPARWQRHMRPVDRVLADIREGALPPITWITPRLELSEHPEYNFCRGENWSTRVIDAIMQGPMWKDTAIFLTWDEYGGFYDHVPPPRVDDFGFGIRVPLLVLSPYAVAGKVSHELGEFSSVLRFIEDNWRLGRLTHRDRHASPMLTAFDFEQPARLGEPLPQRTDCEAPRTSEQP